MTTCCFCNEFCQIAIIKEGVSWEECDNLSGNSEGAALRIRSMVFSELDSDVEGSFTGVFEEQVGGFEFHFVFVEAESGDGGEL